MALIRNKYGRLIETSGRPSSGANSKSSLLSSDGSPASKDLKPVNLSKKEEEKPSSFDVTLIKGGSKII